MRFTLPCLAVALLGCGDMITGPQNRLSISAEYRALWHEVEACSGLPRRSIDLVSFYQVEREQLPMTDTGHAYGYTAIGPLPRIYLTPQATHTAWLLKHEMMHAHGITGHPDEYFLELCGDLMTGLPTP